MSKLPEVKPNQVWRHYIGWECVTSNVVIVGGLCEECEKFGEEREAITFFRVTEDMKLYCWPIDRWHEIVEEPNTGERMRRFTLVSDNLVEYVQGLSGKI